ncbi:MAG: S8 family serine peptidase [Bacillota bacterium]|nr:S8 family serine peptidase [Bacillota bacterium]MDW7685320.1 S8 family serine peptidase [Bacillota bacterium]
MQRLLCFLIVLTFLFTLPAGTSAASVPVGTEYAEGELLVRFQPGAAHNALEKAKANFQTGAVVQKEFTIVQGLQYVKLPKDLSIPEAIQKYRQNPNILYAEPNYFFNALTTPDDPMFSNLWALENTGQTVNGTAGTAGADMKVTEAWQQITGSGDVIIAVLDTGVDYNHPDLKANMMNGWNSVSDNSDPMDDHWHGTHVAGTIAAQGNNGIGLTGVMWNAKIMPVRVLSSSGGTTTDIVEGVEYATANGAQIMNHSYGGYGYSQAMYDAFAASPALMVCAAGNDNTVEKMYPASFGLSNIISVAASDQLDKRAGFSNYGSHVHVFAPGTNILSTVPGSYGYANGTSMAAPNVSGVAGLVKAVNPVLTTAEIKDILLSTVDAKGEFSGVSTGGRINAKKAVDLAVTLIPVDIPDPALLQAIRTTLNKPEGYIVAADMEQLTSLDAQNAGIADLTGLESAGNLTSLTLSNNQITSLEPLQNLVKLTTLILGNNQVSSVLPLQNLPVLTTFDVSYNQLTSVIEFDKLENLEQLDLRGNQLSAITQLPGLPKLQALDLRLNLLDLSPGSAALQDIEGFDPGVAVVYEPQETLGTEPVYIEPETNEVSLPDEKITLVFGKKPQSVTVKRRYSPAYVTPAEYTAESYYSIAIDGEFNEAWITLPYPSTISSGNIIKLAHYKNGQWNLLESEIDRENLTITGFTTSNQEFAILTQEGEESVSPPAYSGYGANTYYLWLLTTVLLTAGLTLLKLPRHHRYRFL